MTKKMVSLFLALALAFTCTACGGKAEETQAPTETAKETTAPRVSIGAIPQGLVGSVYDSYYGSSLLGIEFAPMDGWRFYSQAELAQLCGITDSVSDAAFEEKLQKSGSIYTMYAENESTGSTASVVFEHMEYLYGEAMTEDAFAQLMESQAATRRPGVDVGVSYTNLSTLWLAGAEHPCLELVYTAYGRTYHQTQVFILSGQFMAIISGTARSQNDDGDIVNHFSSLSYSPEPESTTEETQAEE